jgi:choline dehydrogenase-like flavoprotein
VKVHVVGSGPSATHFALSALERGWEVVVLDVGRTRPPAVRPGDSFRELKANLDEPERYFLGDDFEGVVFPSDEDEYYGFPPNKAHVFAGREGFDVDARGFEPLASFARGGLAEAWTGGVYPFNDAELADWPFGLAELAPHYDTVARRIGISGTDDDLARFMPVHDHLMEPLELDPHARLLLDTYERKRARLGALGCHLGRSRSATLSSEKDGRAGCAKLGRCLWTCPTDSLYTPWLTLRELEGRRGFEYLAGRYATHFEADTGGRVVRVVCEVGDERRVEVHEVERLVLGAGTLSSARIFLDSVRRADGRTPRLEGLMDNRQVLMPFVNLRMLGRRWEPDTYQYHQLALALEDADPRHNVHGLITTLKTALIHPIVQSVPFDLRTALFVFRNTHAALGLLNVNFFDDRRPTSHVELKGSGELCVTYAPPPDEPERIARALRRLRRVLRHLGCVVPPGMTHLRPMGASVHYCGTLPMSTSGGPLTTTPDCRSRDFENLWLVDGSTLPFLPAKNLTLTLMANATRVACEAF